MKGIIAHKNIEVRFSDTDAMGVVWHGNYLKFFEDAREYFGEVFCLEYLEIHRKGFFVPISETKIKYLEPIYYGDKIVVEITFHFNKAAKLHFEYSLKNIDTQKVVAKGITNQVFVSAETRKLVLTKPGFFVDWESKQGWVDVS